MSLVLTPFSHCMSPAPSAPLGAGSCVATRSCRCCVCVCVWYCSVISPLSLRVNTWGSRTPVVTCPQYRCPGRRAAVPEQGLPHPGQPQVLLLLRLDRNLETRLETGPELGTPKAEGVASPVTPQPLPPPPFLQSRWERGQQLPPRCQMETVRPHAGSWANRPGPAALAVQAGPLVSVAAPVPGLELPCHLSGGRTGTISGRTLGRCLWHGEKPWSCSRLPVGQSCSGNGGLLWTLLLGGINLGGRESGWGAR